jgi:hypothetical protein
MFELCIVTGAKSSVIIRTGTDQVLRRFATTDASAAYRRHGDGSQAIAPGWRRYWRRGLI